MFFLTKVLLFCSSSASMSLCPNLLHLHSGNLTQLQALKMIHFSLWILDFEIMHGLTNKFKLEYLYELWSIFFLNKTAILREKRVIFHESFARLSRSFSVAVFREKKKVTFAKLSRTTFEALQWSSFTKSFTRGFWSILIYFPSIGKLSTCLALFRYSKSEVWWNRRPFPHPLQAFHDERCNDVKVDPIYKRHQTFISATDHVGIRPANFTVCWC